MSDMVDDRVDPTATGSQPPLVERAVVERLESALGWDGMLQILEGCAVDNERRLGQMRGVLNKWSEEDGSVRDELRALAHAFKGSVANFGLERARRQALELEEAAPDPQVTPTSLVRHVDALSETFERSVEAIRESSS